MKAYYICDTEKRVRLQGWHHSLSAAVERCERLNRMNDSYHQRHMGRYFCGDWTDIKTAQELIDGPDCWPWELMGSHARNIKSHT